MLSNKKRIFLIISASNESQVTSSETKLGVDDDPLRGEKLDSLKYAPRCFSFKSPVIDE